MSKSRELRFSQGDKYAGRFFNQRDLMLTHDWDNSVLCSRPPLPYTRAVAGASRIHHNHNHKCCCFGCAQRGKVPSGGYKYMMPESTLTWCVVEDHSKRTSTVHSDATMRQDTDRMIKERAFLLPTPELPASSGRRTMAGLLFPDAVWEPVSADYTVAAWCRATAKKALEHPILHVGYSRFNVSCPPSGGGIFLTICHQLFGK